MNTNKNNLCAFCLLPAGHTGEHQVQRPVELDLLDAAITERTGGKRLGEMTGDEIAAAFANGPIRYSHASTCCAWEATK